MSWRCALCHVSGTGFDAGHALLRLEHHYMLQHQPSQ